MAGTEQQYDTIQGPYDYIRTASIALIERENVRDTVAPFVQNARVLELACGSGFVSTGGVPAFSYRMSDCHDAVPSFLSLVKFRLKFY